MANPITSGINVRRVVNIDDTVFNAARWDLYYEKSPKDSDRVAAYLNRNIEDLVNQGHPREVVYERMDRVMETQKAHGAYDTEAHTVLNHILDLIYGE